MNTNYVLDPNNANTTTTRKTKAYPSDTNVTTETTTETRTKQWSTNTHTSHTTSKNHTWQ